MMVREQLSSFSPRYWSVYECVMCCAKLLHFAINLIVYPNNEIRIDKGRIDGEKFKGMYIQSADH